MESGVREEMAARDILAPRSSTSPTAAPAFPRRALSTVTTHDLPTLAGLWSGADSRELSSIGVPVNDAALAEVRSRVARVAGGEGAGVESVIVNALLSAGGVAVDAGGGCARGCRGRRRAAQCARDDL